MKKASAFFKCIFFLTAAALMCTVFTFAASAQVTEAGLAETHFLVDWEPTAGSFWNSTGSNKMSSGDTEFNNQYIASAIKFTKDTLPVGSYIFVDSGYCYRPEGWQNETDANTNTRPGYVTTSCVEVTEAWWENYTLRAFNLTSTASGTDLRASFDTAKDRLRIYVPNGTTGIEPYVKLVELQWTLGYWDSSSHARLTTGSSLAKRFVATQMFTRETLPVGSVIEIDSGYKYRPDGWITLDTINSGSVRPGNVTTNRVEVTEDWWGDFTYRGFNISTSGQGDISENYLEVASHFRIYRPGVVLDEPEEEQVKVEIPEDDSVVRVLAIGNSYSNDAMHYTHSIAKGLGINAEFYSLYYGGCTIDQHYNFLVNDSAEYVLYRNNSKYVADKVTMKAVLEAAQFDYITFQQGSWSSDNYSNYARLDELMTIVRRYQPDAEFLIHQTWGYCLERSLKKNYTTSADMFKAVESCYSKAAQDNGNLTIIKSGRAVETAKALYNFSDDYSGAVSIYSDLNSHLSNLGDYLAGCVWVETIFGKDVRDTTYDADLASAYILREIAHQTVKGTSGASFEYPENTGLDTNKAPIIKTAAEDGFDYDGRARFTLYSAGDDSVVRVYYQNDDGTLPAFDGIPGGAYYIKTERNGYLTHTTDSFTVERDGKYSDASEIVFVGGDIKDDAGFCGDGIIDIDDFTRVLRGFDTDAPQSIRVYVDINRDGVVNIIDLAIVKSNFGEKA